MNPISSPSPLNRLGTSPVHPRPPPIAIHGAGSFPSTPRRQPTSRPSTLPRDSSCSSLLSALFAFSAPRYNFHLFPRDELNLGMPSYSFSCQSSSLTSMAREGFDFNACIYDGITYSSRAQESVARDRNPVPRMRLMTSSSSPSVADSVFMGRIKSRVETWWKACRDPGKAVDGSLVLSLRKLILGGELYGSRPCLGIDVSSDHQVQLVLKVVGQICDDLVPLIVPDKQGEIKTVRLILTSSEDDKNLLLTEIQSLEEEEDLKVRGFREVLDVISRSHKPIIGYNCLHDFTFIHSKFIAPLPPSMAEFMCSLRLAFCEILDIIHLLKEVGPLRKANNVPAALSYLRRQFFTPVELEIPPQVDSNDKNHGHNVLQIAYLFAKLNNLLKIVPDHQPALEQDTRQVKDFANIFYPCSTTLQDSDDEDIGSQAEKSKKFGTDNVVLLWGFRAGISAAGLKRQLHGIHSVFSENFELQLVDRTCAIVIFHVPGSVENLLEDMRSGSIGSGSLKEMMSDGLKVTGYEAYKKVCRMGLWEADLAESLEMVSSEQTDDLPSNCKNDTSEIYWSSELMINLNDI
ncbi:Poly(A)-specific ribonuclease protein [Dioscorea alata]|uniref:Poly(A)-specific ribonuclease protein n=1 Tax=Dioscorea alata TaxID=55571 RepID=A0ACB7W661_DIOAL|nr:Poly(A)-specific ribonuclease protein [Dioscorea alata]